MSDFRRRLMMMDEESNGGSSVGDYIQDGLILHLDGIEKGDSSNTWTAKKGDSFYFNGGCYKRSNCVEFDGEVGTGLDGYFLRERGPGETIEVVAYIEDSTFYNQVWIIGPSTGANNFCFMINTNGYLYYNSSYTLGYDLAVGDGYNRFKIMSVNKNIGIYNQMQLNAGEADYWGVSQSPRGFIGCRSLSSNPFYGKIYSIRIYNRNLTKEEMLHNQQVDIKRFFNGKLPNG